LAHNDAVGFELGPGMLRRAPRGWLPARALPLRHSVYDHPNYGPEGGGGETVFDTSMSMSVLWRVEVEVRKGGFDGALNRLANPLAGKLRPEEEALVKERLEREAQREREQRDHLLQQLRGGDGPPPADDEYQELLRRIKEQRRIQRKGRKTTAAVVAREETGRTFATIPLVLLDFDIEGRAVRFEHV
jgi:hypothetical protein